MPWNELITKISDMYKVHYRHSIVLLLIKSNNSYMWLYMLLQIVSLQVIKMLYSYVWVIYEMSLNLTHDKIIIYNIHMGMGSPTPYECAHIY